MYLGPYTNLTSSLRQSSVLPLLPRSSPIRKVYDLGDLGCWEASLEKEGEVQKRFPTFYLQPEPYYDRIIDH